jgi:nucleoside-diphosphate-sugar epimerase
LKILVTGAAGFVGRWTVSELSKEHQVIGTDKMALTGSIQADITNFEQVDTLFKKVRPDAVIHLAAISGSTGKNEIEQSLRQAHLNFLTNAQGTVNICEACRLNGVRRLIYMSSFAVYGRTGRDRLPITPSTPVSLEHAYATSKYMGELAVRTYSSDFGIKSAVFRAPFVAGEHQNERNVLLEFIESAVLGQDLIIYGKGEHVREFLHPIDLVAAFDSAFVHMDDFREPCETFVVGNSPIKIKELAELVVNIVGNGNVKRLEQAVDRAFDQFSDYSKTTQFLGWHPKINVEEIIRRILNSDYVNNYRRH